MSQKVVIENFNKFFSSKRKIEKEKFTFGVNYTYISLLSFLMFLILYYVWTSNANATSGFKIIQLESTKTNLMMEVQRIEVKIAELESLSNIMNDEDLKNMEKVADPNYLVIKDNVQYVYNEKKN